MTSRARLILSSLSLTAAMAAFPASTARAQNAELAAMREDIRILDERTRSLSAEIEQLKRENASLRSQTSVSYATVAQLNNAVSDLEKAIRTGDQQTALQLSQQIEKLAKQTQAAIDTISKNPGPRTTTPPPTNFTEDYPKTGVSYTVQPGDTLASIAQKLNSSVRDIQNANKISDPRGLQVGKVIFVPQRQ